MRLIYVLVIYALIIVARTGDAYGAEKVRVRVATINSNQIEVRGVAIALQGEVSPYQKASIPVRPTTTEKVKVELFNKTWTYYLNEKSMSVDTPYLSLQGDFLQINSQSVPQHVFLWAREDGRIDVVAVLGLEEYLRGVLPHEMPLSWPDEALKAQAILARTFTYKQMANRKNQIFHLDSNVNDQMYRYNSFLNNSERIKLNKILEETKNWVLVDQDKKPVKALYHADCGGQTEKSSRVWGQKEIEFSVKDSNCPSTPYSAWSFEISKEQLQKKLRLSFSPQIIQIKLDSDLQRVQSVQIFDKNTHSKIQRQSDQQKVNVASSIELSSQDFRRLIGYSKIKSTRFEVVEFSNKFLFKGTGFGHGVGLCQWGARGWAKAGLNYKMILNHYFPGYMLANVHPL